MIPAGSLTCLLTAVKEAGSAILSLQKTNYQISRKSNNDIVTTADFLANNILKKYLLENYPTFGWLSEESVDDFKRLQCEYVWIIDPIDGTKEFAAGLDEYAISVALVKKGAPILACVFNPATGELFHAEAGKGAWLNHHLLDCSKGSVQEKSSDEIVLLASRSEFQRGEWDTFLPLYTIKQIGSIAYKLALVAAGKAQATFSLGPKHEWDIAAGVLIVQEAKGKVCDTNYRAFSFNQKNTLVNGVIATQPAFYREICFEIDRAVRDR